MICSDILNQTTPFTIGGDMSKNLTAFRELETVERELAESLDNPLNSSPPPYKSNLYNTFHNNGRQYT